MDGSAQTALDLYLKNRRQLISLACSIVESQSVAEELVQESWLRWHQHSYSADNAVPIFRRIVKNLALDWTRRSGVERRTLDGLYFTTEETRDGERIVIARQEVDLLISALEELSPVVISAFRMYRFEGKTMAGIAKELGIATSSVHGHVVKALAHLTAKLSN